MEAFFSNLDLPTIAQDQKSKLNAPISVADLPLMNMFNHSFEHGTLPSALREANISLILKKGKCPEDCASYRPISLLNVVLKNDLQSFSKTLRRPSTNHSEGGSNWLY